MRIKLKIFCDAREIHSSRYGGISCNEIVRMLDHMSDVTWWLLDCRNVNEIFFRFLGVKFSLEFKVDSDSHRRIYQDKYVPVIMEYKRF